MSRLLVISGVSGAGKSSIIDELIGLDGRFAYIVPFTTRPTRGPTDTKVSVSDVQMDLMSNRGELLSVNEVYGIRCGTPRLSVTRAIDQGRIPLLDWPIARMDVMRRSFPDQTYSVYVLPPSFEVIQQRFAKDGRGMEGDRLRDVQEELEAHASSQYVGICDLEVVSEEGRVHQVASAIFNRFLQHR